MKKLVLKTAFVTLGVTLVLAIAAFGIVSLCAPSVMMDFTASLGMETVSGDYAYQEYERSGDIACLARSFEIAAEHKNDAKAKQRFELLYEKEGEAFADYCEQRDGESLPDGVPQLSYRGYVCGLAACVYYRLAKTAEDDEKAVEFAVSETEASFPAGNPVVALSLEAVQADDPAFCSLLLGAVRQAGFSAGNADYNNIVTILERCANE